MSEVIPSRGVKHMAHRGLTLHEVVATTPIPCQLRGVGKAIYVRHFFAVIESVLPDACHRGRDEDLSHIHAIEEGTGADGSHGIGLGAILHGLRNVHNARRHSHIAIYRHLVGAFARYMIRHVVTIKIVTHCRPRNCRRKQGQ